MTGLLQVPLRPSSFLLSCFQKAPAFLPCLLVVSLQFGYDRKLGVVMHTHNLIYSREAEASVHGQLGLRSQPLFEHSTPQNRNRFSVLVLDFGGGGGGDGSWGARAAQALLSQQFTEGPFLVLFCFSRHGDRDRRTREMLYQSVNSRSSCNTWGDLVCVNYLQGKVERVRRQFLTRQLIATV